MNTAPNLGDLCTSHLMTAWCSTFSPCFPAMRLSKKGTTWQTCSRSQCISVRQFVQRVEQLKSYTVQFSCFYYSLIDNSKTTPVNDPFTKADLVSRVLWMCSLTWQDQFNLHEKGMTPVDMNSLHTSVEAIECICTQEKATTQSDKKASNKGTKGNK